MWLRRLENLAENPGPMPFITGTWGRNQVTPDRCPAMLLTVLTAKAWGSQFLPMKGWVLCLRQGEHHRETQTDCQNFKRPGN